MEKLANNELVWVVDKCSQFKGETSWCVNTYKTTFFSNEEIISANAGDVYAWELVSLKVGNVSLKVGDAIANSSTDTLSEWIHDVGWTCIDFIH